MQEVNNKQNIDSICLRYRKTDPNHDIKISIRKDSFIENVSIELISINKLSAN